MLDKRSESAHYRVMMTTTRSNYTERFTFRRPGVRIGKAQHLAPGLVILTGVNSYTVRSVEIVGDLALVDVGAAVIHFPKNKTVEVMGVPK